MLTSVSHFQIQNSRKKGPEFGKEFGNVLLAVFKHMGKCVNDEKTQKSLERLLKIWGERNIFDPKLISELKKAFGMLIQITFII